jgi:hypothetical protein
MLQVVAISNVLTDETFVWLRMASVSKDILVDEVLRLLRDMSFSSAPDHISRLLVRLKITTFHLHQLDIPRHKHIHYELAKIKNTHKSSISVNHQTTWPA